MPTAVPDGTGLTSSAATALHFDALLGTLADDIVQRATGTLLATGARYLNDPKADLWLGMLYSEPQFIVDRMRGNTFQGKMVPPAQGFTFRVGALPVTLDLTIDLAGYLALHPTLDEQRGAVGGTVPAQQPGYDTNTIQGMHTPGTAAGAATITGAGQASAVQPVGTGQGYKLASVWTKFSMKTVHLRVTIDSSSPARMRIGESELAASLRSAAQPPAGSELFRPRRPIPPVGSLPRDSDLVDQVTWDSYVAANLVQVADLVPPEFRAAVDIEVTRIGDTESVEILAAIVNTTPTADSQLFDGRNPYDAGSIDTRLYEVTLMAETEATLVPYQLEQVAKSYRYDRSVMAFGQATPVVVVPAASSGNRTILQTAHAATQHTDRVHPRHELALPGQSTVPIDTSFASLIADPITSVSALIDAHRAWVDHYWSSAALDQLQASLGWNSAARDEANAEAELARDEVGWVAAGLDLLRTDSSVRDAFILANQTMADAAAASAAPYTSWHPFQIAWIVGCLPGMVNPATHREVNIVWFATGGGKSEAYLGLMAVTLFYGRLTGVTAGAQVWARFPLRLLALQQTERFAEIVCHAELLRRADTRIRGGDPFGIGYFVGGGNTPNKLHPITSPYNRGEDPGTAETAEACRVLENCPVCRRRLDVSFDRDSWTMQHICRNAACALAGVLPVWGIDDEIYRHAPAVLVGTVDKLAQIAQAEHFQVLLGRPHSRCPDHGYTASAAWCAVFGCQASRQPVPTGFGHIRLEVADELHLLEESLGALDGMYETLLQAVCDAIGNPPLQVVGATATIEGFHNQVQHLYQRDARRFPVNGPTVGETFWSLTLAGDPLRRYLGVRPRGISMVTATREVALAHAEWLRTLRDDPSSVLVRAGLDPTDPSALAAAERAWSDLYEVLVAYCLRNEDLTSFTRDDDIQNLLSSMRSLAVINGDAEPVAVRDAVRRLTNPPGDPDERVKIIAATRAIGHGFDVARLGLMTVMGTPTQAAEIIQASARVGRRHPGLVVNITNPLRDRDASVFRYYADWIRFLDRLVHKVPVNRESLPVMRRVLSGGLMAWLLQVHDRPWVTGGPNRKSLATSVGFAAAVRAGFLDRHMLIDDLSRGFGLSPTSVYHQMHREAVATWVDQVLTTLPLRADGSVRVPDLLIPSVPRSLRDVEEPITIHGNV